MSTIQSSAHLSTTIAPGCGNPAADFVPCFPGTVPFAAVEPEEAEAAPGVCFLPARLVPGDETVGEASGTADWRLLPTDRAFTAVKPPDLGAGAACATTIVSESSISMGVLASPACTGALARPLGVPARSGNCVGGALIGWR